MEQVRESCVHKDENNVVAWAAFLYGMAVTSPFNFITLTLPFFESMMPDYPITYVVTFAVNGVMVIVVLVCLAAPGMASHPVKINLSLFIAGALTLFLPFLAKFVPNETAVFALCVSFMGIIGIMMGLALAGSLSYMSLMPARYMALNSMGIGFSGLISLILNAILLLIFGSSDSSEFARVVTFYTLNFVLMTMTASMYFYERNSLFA